MKKQVKLIALVLLVATVLCMLSACGMFADKFALYSCGSGFYFNRSSEKEYEIKDLAAKGNGNSFYLDGFFCSETLGSEYKIKNGLFTVGTVKLAKKSEHYNPKVYKFDLDIMEPQVIEITPEMNYVELTMGELSPAANFAIYVQERTLPLDLTMNNVKIKTVASIPAIFSPSPVDINVILKGNCEIAAGNQYNTCESLKTYIENHEASFTAEERYFYEESERILEKSGTLILNDFKGALAQLVRRNVGDGNENKFEDAIFGDVSAGAHGSHALMVNGGICFSGNGSVNLRGGNGGKGGDRSNSLSGMDDGGAGGNGGCGAWCRQYMIGATATVDAVGGTGGEGGAPSKGLYSSFMGGKKGATGATGSGITSVSPLQKSFD